jgi:hypothetical protein
MGREAPGYGLQDPREVNTATLHEPREFLSEEEAILIFFKEMTTFRTVFSKSSSIK